MHDGIVQARQMLASTATRRRSRAAIVIGSLLAIATVGSVVTSSVRAEGFFEAFQSLFNTGRAAPSYATRAGVSSLAYAPTQGPTSSRRRATRPARRHAASRQTAVSRQAVCVRLCDGSAFPLGASYKRAGIETQEAACAATCPGAETALYLGATGADGLATATAARDGRSYSSLPTALAYTKTVTKSCICGAPATGGGLWAVLRDMTLRRGDAVMTTRGFRIFAGLKGGVHDPKDFHPLARSPEIGGKLRQTLHTLEVASLAAAPHDKFVALDAPSQRSSGMRVPGFQALN